MMKRDDCRSIYAFLGVLEFLDGKIKRRYHRAN